jgi:hypothetical protein
MDLIGKLCGSSKEVQCYTDLLWVQTENFIESESCAIEAVAAALLQRKTLNARQIREVMVEALKAHIADKSAPGPGVK